MKLPPSSIFLIGLLLTSFHREPAVKAATMEESAKAEGEVVLYSSLNNEQIVTLIDAFKKKHPYIKPSFYAAPANGFCTAPIPRPKPDASQST